MSVINYQTFPINEKIAALISTSTADVFDYEDVKPKKVKEKYRGVVYWGTENDAPTDYLTNIRKSEVMSPNMLLNIQIGYGNGLKVSMPDGKQLTDDVNYFFLHNNMTKYLLEQISDQKHFYFSVSLLILTVDGKQIAKIKHKEAYHARFETCNPKTGKIENVFIADWENNPKDADIQAYPVLDDEDPMQDLMVRMGTEPDPYTGKKNTPTTDRIFAIITRFPIPGRKYYPFPYYAAHFNSGWYDVASLIPLGKKAKMSNGMMIKYHVEIHKDYFPNLFKDEHITDLAKQKERKTTELTNIKDYLSGVEKAGKVWFSGFYIDANGKEQNMVKINLIDSSKEGGDWIEDQEEAANVQCYAMGVHPSLIGTLKSSGSLSGTDKRELFTLKQSLEKPWRDMILIPFDIIKAYNKWPAELQFDIPNMMLTTLDEKKDMKPVTSNQLSNDNNNN
jgi:hypothetical protein